MTDYSELKRLADAASPGKWDYEQDCLFFYVDGYTKHLMELCEGGDVDGIQQVENAKFIAAANPAVVLALIAENERLKKMRALDQELNLERELIAERDQFRVEIEALQSDLEMARQAPLYSARMDAQRYRWLRDTHIGDDPESINLEPANKPGLNAAIDAAMSKEV